MSSRPLITVGFTCFNAADTIARAIKTAQEQIWPNIDILIVDDGSSDNSVKIVRGLMEEDKRIRLIEHETNKGTAVARNTITQNAMSEFLAYFDDDDESMPGCLEEQWQRITEYEEKHGVDMVFCYCNRYVVKQGQTKPDHIGYGIGRKKPEPHGREVADYMLWGHKSEDVEGPMGQMGSGTLMLRRTIFDKIGYFDERFRRSAEIDLAVRAALAGAHFISVDKPLINQHKTRTEDKKGKKPLEYSLLLRRKHKTYLQGRKVYWAALATAYSKFYGEKKKIRSRFFYLLACLTAPHIILKNRLLRYVK
jgi:glycosyltransferase involved in cell wall biosynthesis